MFETISRDCIARVGKWTIKDKSVTTPNMLFIDTERIKPIEDADLLLSDHKTDSDKIQFIDNHSFWMQKEKNDAASKDFKQSITYPNICSSLQKESIEQYKYDAELFFISQGNYELLADEIKRTKMKPDVYVLGNSMKLLNNPKEFVRTVLKLRELIGYQKLVYTPGLGLPNHLAVLTYCGVDLFDSVPLIINARKRNFLTENGPHNIEDLEEHMCRCPACSPVKNKPLEFSTILNHNYYAALNEISNIRNAIHNERLRELVENRATSDPKMMAILRAMDAFHYDFQETHSPIYRPRFLAISRESLNNPEVVRFQKRLEERYKKPKSAKILLLLPCSAKKPYSVSRSHTMFRNAVQECGNPNIVHEVIITSPLGIVPRELELFYPAQHYDIPVIGVWDDMEKRVVAENLRYLIEHNKYDAVVAHLSNELEIVKTVVGDCIVTSNGEPTSTESLTKLKNTLEEMVKDYAKVSKATRAFEDLENFAVFQFGNAGRALVADTKMKRRFPNISIQKGECIIGTINGERGQILPTLEGGKILAKENAYIVEIEDFIPKGNVFAVGVDRASPEIRVGDEVVIVHSNEVRGVGRAFMSGREMAESDRGAAVQVRQHIKSA
ncbi:MAG: archaeosine synthase subunit alpha [Thermoplasmata archaeon]